MSPHAKAQSRSSCADGCDSCPLLPSTPADKAPFRGVRFGLISLGYFIVPAVCAIVASRLFGALGRDHGALGAIFGLALGIVGCAIVARRFGPTAPLGPAAPRTRPEDCHE
jgi:hypothetical protein